MDDKTGSVLTISSLPVSGFVGLKAILPGLRAVGVGCVTLPTTLLAAHPVAYPAMDDVAGGPIAVQEISDIVHWLHEAGALDNLAAILSGYMPSLAHVSTTADIVAMLKADRPELVYCCDPICGDNDQLYIPQEVAASVRELLLPQADIITPNHFELSYLSGGACADTDKIVAAARALGVAQVIVTSAPAPKGRIATLSIGEQVARCETAATPNAPHGMGDLFSALYLGLTLQNNPNALGIACATLADMAAENQSADSLPHGVINLSVPVQQKIYVGS